MKTPRFQAVLAAFVSAAVACSVACTSPTPIAPITCNSSADCAANTGVCRSGSCTPTTCSASAPCLAGEACTAGMCVPAKGTPCTLNTDCPSGTGVCRNKICTVVLCSAKAPCTGDEICNAASCTGQEICPTGQCTAPTKASPGFTLSAGGAVSQSNQHIHIGLTGQGRAIGNGASPQHTTTTGATSVMRRK